MDQQRKKHKTIGSTRSLLIAALAASTSACVPSFNSPPPVAVEVYRLPPPQLPEGKPLAATSLPLVSGMQPGTIGAFYRDYVSAPPSASLPASLPASLGNGSADQRFAGVPLVQSSVPLLAQAHPVNPDILPYAMVAESAPQGAQIVVSPAAAQDGGVGALFAAAAALGYQIDDVSMNGDVATLSVSPLPGRLPHATDELAKLALANLPGITRTVINDDRPGAGMVARGPDLLTPLPSPSRHRPIDRPIDRPAEGVALASSPLAPAVPGAGNDVYTLAQKVFDDLAKIGFTGRRFSIDGETAYLEFSQEKYRDNVAAAGHAAHVVAQDAPPQVKIITLDAIQNGSQALYVSIMRGDFEKALTEKGSPEEVWVHAVLAGSDSDLPHGNELAAASTASELAAANPAVAPAGGVDRLFAAADALGYQIDVVSMDGDVATLSVSRLPGQSPHATDKLAKLAIANLPGITRTVINDAQMDAGIVERHF